jgi:ribosome biogenesis protein NSA1
LTEKDYNLSFQCSSTPIGLGMNDNIIFTCTKSGQVELRSIDHDNQQVNQSHQSTSIGNGIQVCRLSPNKTNLFAAGGSDRPLSIYDLSALTNENPVPIYKAKGLGNDHLDLPRPTNITDLAFLPDSPAHVLTADKFGWIRLYDTRDPAARKHSVAHAITEATNFVTTTKNKQKFTCPTHVGYPIRRLIAPTDRMAVLSDTMGNLYQVDFRSGKTVGAFKGIAGAITDVQCDGTHVAAVGLDRHLRVYSWKNRSLVKKVRFVGL